MTDVIRLSPYPCATFALRMRSTSHSWGRRAVAICDGCRSVRTPIGIPAARLSEVCPFRILGPAQRNPLLPMNPAHRVTTARSSYPGSFGLPVGGSAHPVGDRNARDQLPLFSGVSSSLTTASMYLAQAVSRFKSRNVMGSGSRIVATRPPPPRAMTYC